MVEHPGAHRRVDEDRPQLLEGGRRHVAAGGAEHELGIGRRKVDVARDRNADLLDADIGLLDVEPPLGRIVAAAHRDAVERELIVVLRVRTEHDRTAAQAERPRSALLARRFAMRHQGDPVLAGDDLERRRESAARGVPFEAELGAVDGETRIGVGGIDHGAGTHENLSGSHLRHAVLRELGVQAHRNRQIGVDLPVADTQGEQQIAHHELAPLDAHGAASERDRLYAGQQDPGTFGIFRTEAQDDLAPLHARQGEIDLLEFGALPVAHILDHEAAALEPDLGEVAAVEPERTKAVQPRQQGAEIIEAAARRRRGRCRCCHRWRHRETARRCDRDRRAGRRQHGGARKRTLVGGREHSDVAVRLHAHGKLGADQAETLGARLPAQQADARQADLGARRVGDHFSVAVAHHDVANAQGGAPVLIALEHGAADLDTVLVAEILLDRRSEPIGREIEGDGAAGEPIAQCGAPTIEANTMRVRRARGRRQTARMP